MGRRYARIPGRPHSLLSGEWSAETASGRAAIACHECGAVTEIEPPYVVDVGGKVTPRWICPSESCPAADWLELEAFSEEVVA